MSAWIKEYKLTFGFGERHIWSVWGAKGGVHLWITPRPNGEDYGGVEYHYRDIPRGRAPSSKDCWLIGGLCHHSGSSLYASERYIPFWRQNKNEHEYILKMLEVDACAQFGTNYEVEDDD